MWRDENLYWAWEGERCPEAFRPPTNKRIVYANVYGHYYLNGPKVGDHYITRVAVGVWDDDVYISFKVGES